jgi:ubiquinol-cytochrome c reductase cytochrome c1 subunit
MRSLFKPAALAAALVAGLAAAPGATRAAEGTALPEVHWSFDGVFGSFDRAALQRGFQVFKEVCSTCHALSLVNFRNLTELGYSEEEVKAFAAGYNVTDGPNDDGEMFERPALPSDAWPAPYPNEKAARAAFGGAYPPDLSLMAKARVGGPSYIYAILTGYHEPPADMTMNAGMNYNLYFPGNQIAMPQPLTDGAVEYQDGTVASLDQEAHDVATFLMWAAEPKLEARKQTGINVMLFLVVLTGLLFAAKRKVWAALH